MITQHNPWCSRQARTSHQAKTFWRRRRCPLITFGLIIWMKTRHFESFFCGYADHHQSHLRDSDPSTWVQQPRKKALPNPRTEHREAPRPGSGNLKKHFKSCVILRLKAGWATLKNLFYSCKIMTGLGMVKKTDLLYVSRLSKNLGWKNSHHEFFPDGGSFFPTNTLLHDRKTWIL